MKETLLLLVLLGSLRAEEFLPPDSVRAGMKGYGLTVFKGTKVDTFGVEALGVLRNWAPKMDLILVRLSGGPDDLLTKAGVIAGMSGSPVFLGKPGREKLVGAVAYGWTFPKEPICGVTPISSMLEVARRPSSSPNSIPDAGELTPIATPLWLSGFSPSVVGKMRDALREFGMVPISGGGSDTSKPSSLSPGSALGVQLVRGDVTATAIGTLTWVKGDTVLAFGHPMFSLGSTTLPMTGARIYDVFPSVYRSFKLGVATSPMGIILQDRLPAIAGVKGKEPDMLPLRVDVDGKKFRFEVVRHPQMGPFFVLYGLASIAEAAGKSFGESSVELDGKLFIGPDTLNIRNFFSGPAAPLQAAKDVSQVLSTVMENPFRKVRVDSASLRIELDEELRIAWIDGVRVDRNTVRPGGNLVAHVFLRRYLGGRDTLRFRLKVPKHIEGQLLLRVGDASHAERWERERAPGVFTTMNFGQLLRRLEEAKRNDVVYLELVSSERGVTVSGDELPKLPPSALSVLMPVTQTAAYKPVKEAVVLKEERRMDAVVRGGHAVRLRVQRR
ncbi:MAG TPA: hypothetical protein EYP61_09180 [Candidatus Latescibacteria bacterium]|nr:hypothetical protein [Candidatus Latescibacterota bacterium]